MTELIPTRITNSLLLSVGGMQTSSLHTSQMAHRACSVKRLGLFQLSLNRNTNTLCELPLLDKLIGLQCSVKRPGLFLLSLNGMLVHRGVTNTLCKLPVLDKSRTQCPQPVRWQVRLPDSNSDLLMVRRAHKLRGRHASTIREEEVLV